MTIKIEIKTKTYPAHTDLISALTAHGYKRVYMVLEKGEFAIRGNLIDIYSPQQSHPLRIEYFGDEIERINSFDPLTQTPLSTIKSTQIVRADAKAKANFKFTDNTDPQETLADINPEDYVVHEDFGIGIYKGLEHKKFGSREGDYALIAYKGKDKLYVPIDQLPLIHRYTGSENPKINHLHDGTWKRIKKNAHRAINELVEEVYFNMKERAEKPGYSFLPDTEAQIDFESRFPHQETQDQLNAIEEIKRDMESSKPMDRLICGDVGFGKTELILRAAFKACENLKQVAVIAPTTILALQHYNTFQDRFSDFPYKIALLTRFQSNAEKKTVLNGLKNETINIVIGTHRLLAADVIFNDLGLLLIDEEQRFGVTHKEKIKRIKQNVDILTTSATPIPRTLYMALTGTKDLSRLSTPPQSRKPIKSIIEEISPELIEAAITRERERNGQLYYLYNRVEGILKKAAEIKKIAPNLKVAVAHGQMKGKELNQIMTDFYHHKTDLLLSTTIIENGLDIPNVNSIIIENAHRLGLSQLHQIRGRVGRSDIQAYAYLLTNNEIKTETAEKRLAAIGEHSSLGAGYNLAMKDLEIRGAGTLLGERQHGTMTSIGFDLYCQLLNKTLKNEAPHLQDPL